MVRPKSCHFSQINMYLGVKHNDIFDKINSRRQLRIK